MSQRAFALKESAQDSFVDAAVTVSPDGTSLSVGELLKKGKGTIVVDSEQEAEALEKVSVLKSVAVPQVKTVKTSDRKDEKS